MLTQSAEAANVEFARETVPSVEGDILQLLFNHYHEIDVAMGAPLEPDWEQYALQDQAGHLRVYTARDRDDGELVGYTVFFLRPHQHSRNSRQAFADLLYIDPERRGFGPAFIAWCDEQLKNDGAEVVYHSVTRSCDFARILVELLDYEQISSTYARRL